MQKHIITLVFFFLTGHAFCQIGGRSTYEFLNLANSSRTASLGGQVISVRDNDLNFCYYNPSLLNEGMAGQFSLNYMNYFLDINNGYVAYATRHKKLGNIAIGMHYLHYGEFDQANPEGIITGSFKASEYAAHLTWAKPIDSAFTFGVNLKPVYSVLERYHSFGIASDFGITYHNTDKLITSALVIRNLGFQIKPYYAGNREPLPFEIQLAVSKKLEHAPFRFIVMAEHLETIDLSYDEPEGNDQYGFYDERSQPSKIDRFGDKLLRHFNFGLEFTPFNHFYFNVGYNARRRKELQIESMPSTVGISWGFGLKLSKFHIGYGRANYHLAASTNHFSLTTNLNELFIRR